MSIKLIRVVLLAALARPAFADVTVFKSEVPLKDDQLAQIRVMNLGDGPKRTLDLIVRYSGSRSGGVWSGYVLRLDFAKSTWAIVKAAGGDEKELVKPMQTQIEPFDVWTIRALADVIWVFRNGTPLGSARDTTIASGQPAYEVSGDAKTDVFAGMEVLGPASGIRPRGIPPEGMPHR